MRTMTKQEAPYPSETPHHALSRAGFRAHAPLRSTRIVSVLQSRVGRSRSCSTRFHLRRSGFLNEDQKSQV
jgi:hypothetical protein